MRPACFMLPSMPSVHVDLADRAYPVLVESGLLGQAGDALKNAGLAGLRAAIISDDTVARLHSGALISSLEAAGFKPTLHTVPAGEASKSMPHAETLCR